MAITQTALFRTASKPLQIEAPSTISKRIQQIAIPILTELAIAIALTAICIPFVSTWTVAIGMLAGCLVMAIINSLLTSQKIIDKKFQSLPNSSRVINFYCLGAMNTTTLIHETGHFCAAKILFEGNPKIRIQPFSGGWTKWSSQHLTSLGRQLGYRKSMFWITLAGPALALLTASVILIAGLILRNSYPEASFYLIGLGLLPILEHAEYALSALWTPPMDLGHDFVRLKTFGIHPIAAVITILSIPIILILGTMIANQAFTPNENSRLQHPPKLVFG